MITTAFGRCVATVSAQMTSKHIIAPSGATARLAVLLGTNSILASH
jgi:hypothetical protein